MATTRDLLDVEQLLSKLRKSLSRHQKNAADVQQHIDLIKRGQLELFNENATKATPKK